MEETQNKKRGLPVWAAICISVLSVAVIVLGALWAIEYFSNLPAKQPQEPTFKSYTGTTETLISNREQVIATVGNHQLTNARLQIYYWMSVYQFIQENSYYLSMLGFDYTKDLATQACYFDKEISWQEHFIDQALAAWYQYTVLNIAATEAEFKLPAEEQTYLDGLRTTMEEQAKKYGYKDGQEMLEKEMGAGATFDEYIKYTGETFVGMGYFDQFAADIKITDDDLNKYYEDNKATFDENKITKDESIFAWATVRHILIEPVTKDADGNTIDTETAWATALSKAEKLLNDYKKGGKINEEAFAALVKDNTADGGSKENGGLYEKFFKGKMVKEFEEWSFAADRKYGDTGIVKTQFGYHIMFFVDHEVEWRYCAESGMKTEICDKLLSDLKEEYPIDADYEKILIGYVSLG